MTLPHDKLTDCLLQTRRQLENHPDNSLGKGLSDMSWCIVAAIALQEVGIPVSLEEGRFHGWEKVDRSGSSMHAPFMFHGVRFHDPADPTHTVFTDMSGHDNPLDAARWASLGYGWVVDEQTPIEMNMTPLNEAARESFHSEAFVGAIRAFLQSRGLEQSTPEPIDQNINRPRL